MSRAIGQQYLAGHCTHALVSEPVHLPQHRRDLPEGVVQPLLHPLHRAQQLPLEPRQQGDLHVPHLLAHAHRHIMQQLPCRGLQPKSFLVGAVQLTDQ
jgi:hypothetical protein